MRENLKVRKIKPSAVALVGGCLGLAIGLCVSALVFLRTVVLQTVITDSVLVGLLLGLEASLLTMLVIPVIYLAAGAVVGYLHAFIFNAVSQAMGGVTFFSMERRGRDDAARPFDHSHRHTPAFGERLPTRRTRRNYRGR